MNQKTYAQRLIAISFEQLRQGESVIVVKCQGCNQIFLQGRGDYCALCNPTDEQIGPCVYFMAATPIVKPWVGIGSASVETDYRGFVKIGKAVRLRERLKEWERNSPVPLYVWGYIPTLSEESALRLESQLQQRFDVERVRKAHRNEWFFPTPDLVEYIQQYARPLANFGRELSETYWL